MQAHDFFISPNHHVKITPKNKAKNISVVPKTRSDGEIIMQGGIMMRAQVTFLKAPLYLLHARLKNWTQNI